MDIFLQRLKELRNIFLQKQLRKTGPAAFLRIKIKSFILNHNSNSLK